MATRLATVRRRSVPGPDGVITAARNLLAALAAFLVALVIAAMGQAAFAVGMPALGARIVGGTDVAMWILLVLLATTFFCVGLVVPRWLRGSWPLAWLLLPVASLYLLEILVQPGAYRCNPLGTKYVVSCWITMSPLLVSASAIVAGYGVGRSKQRSGR